MKEFGVEEIWTTLFKFSYHNLLNNFISFVYFLLVAITRAILLWLLILEHLYLIWEMIDTITKCIKKIFK